MKKLLYLVLLVSVAGFMVNGCILKPSVGSEVMYRVEINEETFWLTKKEYFEGFLLVPIDYSPHYKLEVTSAQNKLY